MRARVVDNPRSYRGPYPVARVLPTLRAAGWTVDVVHRLPGVGAHAIVEAAAEDGVELLVAAGGDGTLRDLASALAGTTLTLGLLPGGTANVFAHDRGIPERPERAARSLIGGREQRLDLGHLTLADGRWGRFLLMAGVGLDGAALQATHAGLKRRAGPLAIALGLALALPRLHLPRVAVRVDGRDAWEGRPWELLVSNVRLYANLVAPSPDARPDDGLLDLCVLSSTRPRALLRTAATLALERHPDPAGARWFRGRQFEIDADAPQAIQLDGTPLGRPARGPFRVSVEPGALRVRLPLA